jgi:hypothetical protein
MKALNKCKELEIKFPQTVEEVKRAARGFESISTQGCIWNCVSVADGYHLQTQTPSKTEVKNVRSFFSGHYQCYGVNVQAACDHHCRFTFLGVAAPGVTGDRDAIDLVALGSLVKNLPGLYCVIVDCAYTATEKLVPIFRGDMARISRNDVFNFYASQLRIRIEMAFGLMVQKWGILCRSLRIKIRKVKRLIMAIARLHNYCINRRLMTEKRKLKKKGRRGRAVFTPKDTSLTPHEVMLRENAANFEWDEMHEGCEEGWSRNRDRMAKEIEYLKLSRPGVMNKNK